MEEQIRDLIKRYTNHLNCWKHSLKTYENGLDKTPRSDKELRSYWVCQVDAGKAKVEIYQQIVNDLKSLV